MGRINNAFDALVSQLTAAGLTVVNDSRNARPGTVLVEPASVSVVAIRGGQVMLEFPVIAMAPPPGNADAMRTLNDMVDKIIDTATATAAQNGSWGDTNLPATTVTVMVAAQN